jgi:hypothetical protein
MKTILAIAIVVAFALIGTGIWFFTSTKSTQQTIIPSSTVSLLSPTNSQNQSVSNQPGSAGTPSKVKEAFLGQIQNSNLITFGNTAIVSSYALQSWGSTDMGGEALLEYDSAKGWMLITMNGGIWSVQGLVDFGVPQSIAEQLIADLRK